MREPWRIHWRDYYEILQVSPTAETEVIDAAYRRLARKYHSDIKPAGNDEQMRLITEAGSILRDASKRRIYDIEYFRRNRPGPAPKPTAPQPIQRVTVLSITSNVSRAGNKFRFQIRVEGDNLSNISLAQSGVTINIPTVDSHNRYLETEIQASSVGCNPPFRRGPGEKIWGFLDNGKFGQKLAKCLFIECIRDQWPPHERIALDAVLFTPLSRLDAHVRVWGSTANKMGGDGFGDPDWASSRLKDQQQIPTYHLSLGLD